MIEKREYFRVSGRVGLRIERLDEEAWEAEAKAIRADATAAREVDDNEVTRRLDRLERKLDLVLAHLEIPNPTPAVCMETQNVTISGSGFAFDASELFEPGTGLRIQLELGLPLTSIQCLGRVIESERREAGSKVVVAFAVIREVDRDRIIEFTLETERRSIRKSGNVAA